MLMLMACQWKAVEVAKFPEVLNVISSSVTASCQSAPYVQT